MKTDAIQTLENEITDFMEMKLEIEDCIVLVRDNIIFINPLGVGNLCKFEDFMEWLKLYIKRDKSIQDFKGIKKPDRQLTYKDVMELVRVIIDSDFAFTIRYTSGTYRYCNRLLEFKGISLQSRWSKV